MFCWNCGTEIEDRLICPHCGVRQAPAQASAANGGKQGNTLLIVACAAIGGMLLLGMLLVGVLLLLAGNREEPEEQIRVPASTSAPAPTREPAARDTIPTEAPTPTEVPSPTEPAKLDEPDPKQEETIDEYSCALPDLATFLETEYTQDVWGYTHYVTCLIDKEDEEAVMDAVLELLLEPRYQLKKRDTWSGTEDGKKCTYYSFEYTGKNRDVDWIYTKSGRQYYVRVMQMAYSSTQTAIVFSSHPEFVLKDPGRTWKEQPGEPAKPSETDTPGITGARELPSFLKTKGEDFYVRQYDPSNSAKHYTGIIFGADVDEADAAEKYVHMLVKDYGYKVIHTQDKKLKNYYNYSWHLAHPDSAVGRKHPLKSNGGDADVTIKIIQYFDAGDCTLEMSYVTDLTFPDAEGQKPKIKDGETACSCNRGDCWTCGGDGKVWTQMIGTGLQVEQDCTDFYCSNGSCTICGGDGVLP